MRRSASSRKAPPPDVVQPGASVLRAVYGILNVQYRLFNESRTCMLEGDGSEALHDMRVAINRFRSGLRLFRPFLAGIARKDLTRLMSKFRARLGTARDSEVWMAFLDSVSRKKGRRRDSAWRAYLGKRNKEHTVLRKGVVRLLAGGEYGRLDHRADVFLGLELPGLAGRSPGGSFAAYAAGRLRRGYKRVIKHKIMGGPASSEQMHALRKRCRRLRYWAEFAAPVLGKTVLQLARRLKAVTTSLGNVHDMDLYLERIRTGSSAAPAWLEAAIGRKRASALRAFEEAWGGLTARNFEKRVLNELRLVKGS